MLIGLTGGIGAGKSTVAAALAAHGATVIDADQVARDVVAVGEPALAALVKEFGKDILSADGNLDRPALGRLVFGNPERVAILNSIVHPAVQARTQSLFAAAGEKDVVVYDVPLLIEAKLDYPFDLVVVAMAPAEVRLQRLLTLRGMNVDEAQARISSQASDDERRAVADVIIDTAGSLEETQRQVDELWLSSIEPWIRSA